MAMHADVGNSSGVIALLRECGTRGKKCVINLSPVWANSNQSVQILESISSAQARLSLSQPITIPDTTIARADNENFCCSDTIVRRLRFFLIVVTTKIRRLVYSLTFPDLLYFLSLSGKDTCPRVIAR